VEATINSLDYKRGVSGIYFLADDFVAESSIALLNSLRAYAPTCMTWCIPFSGEISVIKRLATTFGFRIYDDRSLFELDNIGHSLCPDIGGNAGMFRKLAVFWGPLEHFIYLDADVVILDDVQPLFTTLSTANYDLLYANSDLEMVYKPGAFRDRMVREYETHGFNTGVWASSLGQLSLGEIRAFGAEAISHVDSFAIGGEQPFVNYCLDRKRIRMASFSSASEHRIYWNWPSQTERLHVSVLDQSRIQVHTDRCQFVSGMHWAGFSTNSAMPHYEIYLYFRLLSSTRLERLKWHVKKWLGRLARRLLNPSSEQEISLRLGQLALNILSRWSIKPLPPKPESGLCYLTIAGRTHWLMLRESMFSLYRSWKKLPAITIVSDGSWLAADFYPAFSWWPGKIKLLSREQIVAQAAAAGERELAQYAEASPYGLKLASIVLLARQEPVLFVDSDILWFADPANLLGPTTSWAKPRGLGENNCYQHRDMALRFCPEVLKPPFVNGGILALHGEFLTTEILRAMVREALADPKDGAFEQTIIATAVHKGAGLLPTKTSLVSVVDAYGYFFRSAKHEGYYSRHYTTATRHLIYRDALKLRFDRAKS